MPEATLRDAAHNIARDHFDYEDPSDSSVASLGRLRRFLRHELRKLGDPGRRDSKDMHFLTSIINEMEVEVEVQVAEEREITPPPEDASSDSEASEGRRGGGGTRPPNPAGQGRAGHQPSGGSS